MNSYGLVIARMQGPKDPIEVSEVEGKVFCGVAMVHVVVLDCVEGFRRGPVSSPDQ